MGLIHDTYQITMKDGSTFFIECDVNDVSKANKEIMEKIYATIKEKGYTARDLSIVKPVMSTDPDIREQIRNMGDVMDRMQQFFRMGGDLPEGGEDK